MGDKLENYIVYVKSNILFDKVFNDTDEMMYDDRGKEIAKQLVRSAGSIPANIEEGYGRGHGKEFAYFLRISRGSARETKGWYNRAKKLLDPDLLNERKKEIDEVISLLISMINTLEKKEK